MLKKITVCLLSIGLSACSEFYTYQPPAPIYKKPEANNPYKDLSEQNAKELAVIKRAEPITHKSQPYSYKTTTLPLATRPLSKPLSPAIKSLVLAAEKNSQAGEYDLAVSTLERALRIESRNPILTYKLAKVRLKQSKPQLAEDLAKKAALLSAQDRMLKKQSWLLISEARKLQNNYYGAKQAKLKADNI